MVPLHYDNMLIHVIDKHFLRLRKKHIFQRKNCDISYFSQTIDCGYTEGESEVYPHCMS